MASAAAPPPIVGTPVDPPPSEVPGYAEKLNRSAVLGAAYRTINRYTYAKVGLLASGTAYYMFLALLSMLAFTYGIIALVGAEDLADRMTEYLEETLPGLVGSQGINPEQLRTTGAAAGIVGLVLMLYSSLGAVGGVNNSLHLIYGAPPDPRNFLKGKLRSLGILFTVGPLIALSFVAVSLTSDLVQPVLEEVGLDSTSARTMLAGAGLILGYALDVLILWILLGTLGGIRPHRRPRLIAAMMGAVAIGLIKLLLGFIISWSLDRPQYGALAIPLAILFLMSLLATTLYLTAALAAGISDEDIPLEALEPSPEDAVVSVPDPADDEPADEEVPEAGSRDAVRAPDLGTPAGTDWHETGPRS